MRNIQRVLSVHLAQYCFKLLTLAIISLLLNTKAISQTFEFPSLLYVDSISLHTVVSTSHPDTLIVRQGDFSSMTNAINGPGFTIKSIIALTNFKVNVQSLNVGQKPAFTYKIMYRTIGFTNPADTTSPSVSSMDSLSVSYNRDSLKLINDRAFKIAGNFHQVKIIIYDVYEITNSGSGPQVQQLNTSHASGIPTFVNIFGEIYVQKFGSSSSMSISGLQSFDSISTKGIVRLAWNPSSSVRPGGYEIEWTYADPVTDSVSFEELQYDFRNNATRVFTNNTSFNIPVAQKNGYLVYRVRMVRPNLNNLLARSYGPWTVTADQGNLSDASRVPIPKSSHDDVNWDLKINFVEDGKYKQVITYYDGLLKPKQVQTRFNSKPLQTIVAQSLYDHEGRAVINTLPIPVNGVSKFSYVSNFLRPVGAAEYNKLDYDAIPNPNLCPAREIPISPLDPEALSNKYYSRFNVDTFGKNAFIPDAEGYPLVRKIIAAENGEKVLYEGQAGSKLQLGKDRYTEYFYGAPLQAELNKYFGQDIGKANYYRKKVTTDNHDQDMFSITDDEGRLVVTGLIGTPDTNELALSVRNFPVKDSFKSNLLPVPNIRLGDDWRNSGSHYIELDANYLFQYRIDYKPYKPCPDIDTGLMPRIFYEYEVIDACGQIKLQTNGALGGIGMTPYPSLTFFENKGAFLKKGNYVWNKRSYITMEDLSSSVDYFIENTKGCYETFNSFLKKEFIKAKFPCVDNYDPCAGMRLAMIKEMYPRAKYGKYDYGNDTVSKTFYGPKENSIFTYFEDPSGLNSGYAYQSACIQDSVLYMGKKYSIKTLQPTQLIPIFNDSIGAALLPLHPDYCKLKLCNLINNPYCKILGAIEKASEAIAISRYTLDHIVHNDPLLASDGSSVLTIEELSTTIGDSLSIDSIAFKKTICGSDFGVIESVCGDIYATKTELDIVHYPEYMRDQYYQNLIKLYTENREKRLGAKLQQIGSSCGPCSDKRLINPDNNSFAAENDTTILVSGIDSITTNTKLPVSTFGNYFDPVQSANMNQDSLNNLKNLDNSVYCIDLVKYITNTLNSCNVSQAKLNELSDTLSNRFCKHNNSITSLSYDSLSSIMTEVGISLNDLCNPGLVDLRKITRKSSDFVQLGLLHYAPAYYDDLAGYLQTNQILNFIADTTDTLNISLSLCDAHPFQQNLASQFNATLNPTDCNDTIPVTLVKTNLIGSNAVKISFFYDTFKVAYYLYPAKRSEYNALNTAFGSALISNTQNYKLNSLFNLYGFDKMSNLYANRNTILLTFDGTQSSAQKHFSYLLSAFNEKSDYNLMEKDRKDYLNGIGCSEFIPMAKEAITMAEQLNIKSGHPYFEQYFTNVVNYRNSVNFDFQNYYSALQSCGLTDSIIIQKNIAHFKIKFSSTASINDVKNYVNVLRNTDSIGISDVQSYNLNNYYYLLLNIYEANGKTINYAKQKVQTRLPAGSTLEYMPYLPKGTVAQLLSNDFNPVDISALQTAFPGAGITDTSIDLYYFVPGNGSGVFMNKGKYITMTQSITGNYNYNHYVDSIYRFVYNNAPITSVFSHAEPAVSAQYYDWQMTAWRNYTNAIASGNHNELVKKSKAEKFQLLTASGGGNSFTSSRFSYKNARMPHYLNHLYIDHDPYFNSSYGNVTAILYELQTYNKNSYGKETILRPTASSSYISTLMGGNTETRAYKCGDTTQFWINHFDQQNKMTNIFIQLPAYLPLARDKYKIFEVSKGFEKDSVTYINLVLEASQGTIKDTIECIGYVNRNMGENYTIPAAFLSSHSQLATLSARFENCETRKLQELYPIARINYNIYKDSVRNIIVAKFRQHIIDSLQEQLSIIGNDIKNGITLYYYDVAGNLVKTIPPAGVDQMDVIGANNDSINAYRARYEKSMPLWPAHSKATYYYYNAQNKVTESYSPDGGKVTSRYDLMGRVVITQNDKQKSTLYSNGYNYTYFMYDELSRVIETGIINWPAEWSKSFFTQPGTLINSTIKGQPRSEVTVTMYDTASYQVAGPFAKLPAQENLKNRVSCTKYFEVVGAHVDASADTNYVNALHYSYDVSGNVKTHVYDLRNLVDPLLRMKRVDYEYDLYSGKVLLVSYNRGFADQFYQKYFYDSDNRIVDVQTSNNGLKWDRDAHYEYYDHGPLARTELGEQRVQGVDYAYTINGWLKAINGIQNDPRSDMGKDGATNAVMPKDVFSQTIEYFGGDYKAIKDSNMFRQFPSTLHKYLYNGNIAGIGKALAPFANLYDKYYYDPLQRIDRAYHTYYTYDYGTSTMGVVNGQDYYSQYRYDLDGNLLKLSRRGAPVPAALNGGTAIAHQPMDELTYRYGTNNNRLRNLADSCSTVAYKIDIPPLTPDTSLDHYEYDETGNMKKDLVSGLTSIEWNRLNKVKSITRLDGSRIHFAYDPMGNRLVKEVVTYPATDKMVKLKTIYVRDASGNSLAVYEDKKEFAMERINMDVVANDPLIGHTTDQPIPDVFAHALADELCAAYIADPGGAGLAKLSMAVPGLSAYVDDQGLLQNLVQSLANDQRLAFTKSIPAITKHTLNITDGGSPVSANKLGAYMQPILLSDNLDQLQTDLFAAVKTKNESLYYMAIENVPADETEKANFPGDPAMLDAYKGMNLGDKMQVISILSEALTSENIDDLPTVAPVIAGAYTLGNTYADFVEEVPNPGYVYDQLRDDALSYITYRYAEADLEHIPLDSVKQQFKTNGVLAQALSQESPDPEPSALAAVLSTNMASVISAAQSSGQGTTFVDALKGAIKHNVIDVVATDWYRNREILQRHNIHLAEHHIYGSSRLGMQKYLPQEVAYAYGLNQGTGGSASINTLAPRRPWYSRYGNDLFSHALYGNDLQKTNMNTDSLGINAHILGNRHYELTNHLGNVQATILDRTTPIIDHTVTGYKADIATAQDYYPFGMYMPGRYVTDTGKHCVTVNTTILVPKTIKVWMEARTDLVGAIYLGGSSPTPVHQLTAAASFAEESLYLYHYVAATEHPGGTVATTSIGGDGQMESTLDLSYEPSGISAYLILHPDTSQGHQRVGFGITLDPDHITEVRVRQYNNNSSDQYYDALGWQTITTAGDQQLLVPVDKASVLAGGKTILELRISKIGGGTFPGGRTVTVFNPYTFITTYVPESRIATICDEPDNYRFGFNGKEKDNEAKGIGNSLDFGARIHDPRLGRFLSLDPDRIKYPYWSPYAFAGNSPLRFIDLEGKGPGDVVIVFAGADLFRNGDVGSAQGIVDFIKQKDFNANGGYANAFASKYWGTSMTSKKDLDIATQSAYDAIKANYNVDKGEKVDGGKAIIYGYSWGGVLAQHLTDRLKNDGVKVDLLVTIDAAAGPQSDKVDRTVSDNVKDNLNIYQTKPSLIRSHGDKNVADDGKKTKVRNSNYTDYYEGEPGEKDYKEVEHGTIDEMTQPRVNEEILNTVQDEK